MRKILCFGDSNTWGYNGRSGEQYPENIRWTGLLRKRMSGMGVEIIEQGLCGRTTVFEDLGWSGRRGMDVFPDVLKEASPVDILILMLGTNDCKTEFHADPEMIGEGMEETCAQPGRLLLRLPFFWFLRSFWMMKCGAKDWIRSSVRNPLKYRKV